MSKLSLFRVAVALVVLRQNPSYAIDLDSFYWKIGNDETVTPVSYSAARPTPGDIFEVSPLGRIDEISSAAGPNIFGVTIPLADLGDDTVEDRQSNANVATNPNTSYSLSAVTNRASSKCGPSPMTVGEIEELVGKTAQSYGVDPGFAKAIAWVESRFDQNRNSQQGARGPMQLMPATASELGVGDICDPVANIDGGIRHLKLMLDEFQNPILAAAAYNAGAQAVYDSHGVPPFRETVRYVADVINHQIGLRMPRKAAARGIAVGKTSPSSNEMASDVIDARGSRFIKGVMQF